MKELKLDNQEKNNLRLLCRILRSFGYKTFTISDGFSLDYLTTDEINNNDVLTDIIDEFDIESLLITYLRRGVNFPEKIKETLKSLNNKIKDINLKVDSHNDGEVSYVEMDLIIDIIKYEIDFGYSLSYTASEETFEEFTINSNVLDEFERLKPGCEHAVTSFEGSGDSGYLESTIQVDGTTFNIPATIEDECYELLSSHFPGWEINEGSSGRIEFNIEEKSGSLHITTYLMDNVYESVLKINF